MTGRQEFVPGYLILMFNPGMSDEDCRRIITGQGHTVTNHMRNLPLYLIAIPAGQELALAARYSAVEGVKSADLNHHLETAGG